MVTAAPHKYDVTSFSLVVWEEGTVGIETSCGLGVVVSLISIVSSKGSSHRDLITAGPWENLIKRGIWIMSCLKSLLI